MGSGQDLDRLDRLCVARDRPVVVTVGKAPCRPAPWRPRGRTSHPRPNDGPGSAMSRAGSPRTPGSRPRPAQSQTGPGRSRSPPPLLRAPQHGRRPNRENGRRPPPPRAVDHRSDVCRPRRPRTRRGGTQPSPPQQKITLPLLDRRHQHPKPEDPSGHLIDQCSQHDIPPAVEGDLTDQQGHDLDVRLKARATSVLTRRRLGGSAYWELIHRH